MNGFLLDTNIFINANRYYRREFFPVVWHFFQSRADVLMLNRVYQEIAPLNDELSQWATLYYRDRLVDAEASILEYRDVAGYLVASQNWKPAGYEQWTTSFTKADPWLIACAKHSDYWIVTDENNTGPNGAATANEPKIPFVAHALGVRTVDFWEFLGLEHFKVSTMDSALD